MRVCVITDNEFIFKKFVNLIYNSKHDFDFYYSSFNKIFVEKYKDSETFKPLCLKDMDERFFKMYDVFISLHSKQIFPDELVQNHRCINVHPGLNPYNRGWYPQVFSIINKLPVGVTIHEMDKELDHGPIICQKELVIKSYETSFDVYNRILSTEIEMIEEHLDEIIENRYKLYAMDNEGNVNYKEDFNRLCEIDLKKKGTFGEFIDLLRATTFDKYDNAFFVDEDGKKVFVSVNLKKVPYN